MFTRIDDFSSTWTRESTQTARVLAELTDASLGQRIAQGYRSLGDLAWHVVVSPRTIMRHAALEFDAPDKTVPAPDRAAELHSTYVDVAKSFLEAVRQTWSDGALLGTIDFYGREVTRGTALSVLLHHEIHHRGQMTVLMRQAGLRVPGVYGPAREERG